jgi:division protein CdvB (Snf7/Vps24/ESCRT-III family)
MLAREVVRANKQRDRLVSSKARVGSVQMQLQNQLGESQAPFGIDDEAKYQ